MNPHERRVAQGPVDGTDWCVLDDPPDVFLAPGGVVLCVEGTLTPHPDAARAACSAWELLDYENKRHRVAVDAFAERLDTARGLPPDVHAAP